MPRILLNNIWSKYTTKLKTMSEDRLDKNGIWQGTQGEYFEFAKEIIDECYDRDSFQVIDPMLEEIFKKKISQNKLESIISKHTDKNG